MASKRTVTSTGSDKRRDAKAVLKLSRRADAEVAKLLKRNEAGTITRVELNTGLKEVEHRLYRMMVFLNKLV
jgi:hypothetical protein